MYWQEPWAGQACSKAGRVQRGTLGRPLPRQVQVFLIPPPLPSWAVPGITNQSQHSWLANSLCISLHLLW